MKFLFIKKHEVNSRNRFIYQEKPIDKTEIKSESRPFKESTEGLIRDKDVVMATAKVLHGKLESKKYALIKELGEKYPDHIQAFNQNIFNNKVEKSLKNLGDKDMYSQILNLHTMANVLADAVGDQRVIPTYRHQEMNKSDALSSIADMLDQDVEDKSHNIDNILYLIGQYGPKIGEYSAQKFLKKVSEKSI